MRIVTTIRHACWATPVLLVLSGPASGQSPLDSLAPPPSPAPSAAAVMAERLQNLDVFQSRGADKGLVVHVGGDVGIGVDLRGAEYQDVLVYRREVPLGHAQAPNPDRRWHHLRVEARGSEYSSLVDGRLVLRRHDKLPGARLEVWLANRRQAGSAMDNRCASRLSLGLVTGASTQAPAPGVPR